MGFWKRLFGKSSPSAPAARATPNPHFGASASLLPRPTGRPIEDSNALREELFAAANAGDGSAHLALCQANRESIVRHFPAWKDVKSQPGVNLKDARQMQYIITGLGATAEVFRDQLGNGSLWDQLTGGGAESPFDRFERTIKEAHDLAAALRFQESADLLTTYLIDIKDLAGSGADKFRAHAHGTIGTSLFQAGRAADALEHLRQALDLCAGLKDSEGVAVYLRNLYEAHRYLGEAAAAADYACRLADLHGGGMEESTWRRCAIRVRAGEPLVRMTVHQGNQRLELDELKSLEGRTTYHFERNRPTLMTSTASVVEGNRCASDGRLDEALGYYRAAAKADPFDPDPHYQAGLTLLLLRRYVEAVEEYEITRRLAPGWFHVDSDLWLAQEILAGRVAHEAFLAAWLAEDIPMELNQKLSLIEQSLERGAGIPHLHLGRALVLNGMGRKAEALAALNAGIACKGEPDVHSRLLAQLAAMSDRGEQRRLFEEIQRIPGANLMSRTMAATILRLE